MGSGAGFPGFVLAATCPELRVTLIESRQRKWSFLQAAARRAGLPLSCLNLHLEPPLSEAMPDTIDILTLRALQLPARTFEALRPRLRGSGRLLLWQTGPPDEVPPGFQRHRVVRLPGSERRCIAEYRIAAETQSP